MATESQRRLKIINRRLAKYTRGMRARPGSPLAELNKQAHTLADQAFLVLDEMTQRLEVVTKKDSADHEHWSEVQRGIMTDAIKKIEENTVRLRTEALHPYVVDALKFDAEVRMLHAELNPAVVKLREISDRMDLRGARFKNLCHRLFEEILISDDERNSRRSFKDFLHFSIGRIPIFGAMWSGGRVIKGIFTRDEDREAIAREYEHQLMEFCVQIRLWIEMATREMAGW